MRQPVQVRCLLALAALLLGACAPTDSPPPSTPPAAAIATIPPAQPTPSPPASRSPTPSPTARPTASVAPSVEPIPVTPAPEGTPQGRECEDDAYSLSDFMWNRPLKWKFNPDTVPARYDADRVLEVVKLAFANVTDARNLCGRPDNVDATAVYIGTTRAVACKHDSVLRDFSVVSFGPGLPDDPETIAYTCPYMLGATIVAADIVITTNVRWALSESECRRRQHILEAVMTHEVGHAFGLGHVGRRHNDLTMRPRSGPCEYGDVTLGLGDLLGLEELYGPDQ
jgi:hypothetical protein